MEATETVATSSLDAMKKEERAYERRLQVVSLEEDFLKQRSKLHWSDLGDQNNKAFHNSELVKPKT